MSQIKLKSISFDCPKCEAFQTVSFPFDQTELNVPCGSCGKEMKFGSLKNDMLQSCPVCSCPDLHQHKDFNKKLGLALFVVGAIFAPWTYYLSLIGALAIDAALFPFFPWMQVCYSCKSEFRGWEKNPELDRFNHEVAAKYEYGKKTKAA